MNPYKIETPDSVYLRKVRGGITNGTRHRLKRQDAWARFERNFQIRYPDSIVRKPIVRGFKGYNLGVHDLLGIRSYERTGEIGGIIKERAGEPYLIGIELEIEQVNDRERVGDILARYLPDRHICVRDGSIDSSGVEVVTAPLAPREVGRVPWYNLLRELSRAGCRSHDSGACGLHVSVSRGYLHEVRWRAIEKWLYRDRALFESLSRRTIGKGTRNGDPFGFCRFTPGSGKYQALNLSKGAVAEFRFFRGTLSPASFLASIEIVRSIVEYAHAVSYGTSGRAPRLSVEAWVKFLDRSWGYGMAREYIAPHLEIFRGTAKERRGNKSAHRVARTIVERLPAYMSPSVSQSGEIVIGNGDNLLSWQHTASRGTIEREIRIPIRWDRSHGIPRYLRSLIDAGKAPREIVLRSFYSLSDIERRRAEIDIHRAGWGTHSRATIRIGIEG